ncbi:MAG: bromoperoxidase [Pseudomonadota bacterium]
MPKDTHPPDPTTRQQNALERRISAAKLSSAAPLATPPENPDETTPYLFSFTKGLKHSDQGIVDDPGDFETFRDGTKTPDPAVFETVDLVTDHTCWKLPEPTDKYDGYYRRWESPTGGHAYVLQGPDPQAVPIPPAPQAGGAELAAEMAEVYMMALDRDLPVGAFMDGPLVSALDDPFSSASFAKVEADATRLSGMRWFQGQAEPEDALLDAYRSRRRFGDTQTARTLFRGIGEGTQDGPFVSQFLVAGTKGPGGEGRGSGQVRFGNQRISQDVRMVAPGRDFMTGWDDWLNVQNAFDARRALEPSGQAPEFLGAGGSLQHRPILTLRDLATYVHDDALYQAYLSAALTLLGEGAQADSGIPYHAMSHNSFGDNRAPFAVFGGPHLLTLVTEAASRALRAVRWTKFTLHRRCRPEVLAARFHTVFSGYDPSGGGAFSDSVEAEKAARALLSEKIAPYTHPTDQPPREPSLYDVLMDVRVANAAANGPDAAPSWLLPMAFPEGSPMHPAYGAGHATVAGACVTMLKAFFEMGMEGDRMKFVDETSDDADKHHAYVPVGAGAADTGPFLKPLTVPGGLSLVGELNKLAWNISNARNIAGVHYFTDSVESLLLGEAITIGILREQMCTYDPREKVSMTVPLFVERTLPAALLVDEHGNQSADFSDTDPVREIEIRSDGSLKKVS